MIVQMFWQEIVFHNKKEFTAIKYNANLTLNTPGKTKSKTPSNSEKNVKHKKVKQGGSKRKIKR